MEYIYIYMNTYEYIVQNFEVPTGCEQVLGNSSTLELVERVFDLLSQSTWRVGITAAHFFKDQHRGIVLIL